MSDKGPNKGGGGWKNDRKRKYMSGKDSYHQHRRPRSEVLSDGIRGFLITCGDERRAVTDAYRLFEQYSAKLSPADADDENKSNATTSADSECAVKVDNTDSGEVQPDKAVANDAEVETQSLPTEEQKDGAEVDFEEEEDSDSSDDLDISERLNAAAAVAEQLAAGGASSGAAGGGWKRARRQFQQMKIGIKNCLFIRTTLADPADFVYQILCDVRRTGKQHSRHLNRIIPVEVTCKIQEKAVESALGVLITKHFKDTGFTYAVEFKSRHQSSLNKDLVVDMAGGMVQAVSPLSRANLGKPERTIMVELFQTTCCLCVLREYAELSRYNIQQIALKSAKEAEATSPPAMSVAEAAVLRDKADTVDPDVSTGVETVVEKDASIPLSSSASVKSDCKSALNNGNVEDSSSTVTTNDIDNHVDK